MIQLFLLTMFIFAPLSSFAYQESRELLQAVNTGLCNLNQRGIIKASLEATGLSPYFEIPPFDCHNGYPAVPFGLLEEVIKSKTLTLCNDPEFSEFTQDYRNLIAGNLTLELSHRYGLIRYKWFNITLTSKGYFSSLAQPLQDQRCHMVFTTATITTSRNKYVDFGFPYLKDYNGIVRSKSNPQLGHLNTTHELMNTNGIKVATIPGSIYYDWVKSNMPNANLVSSIDIDTGLSFIDTNLVDVFLWDYGSMVHYFEIKNINYTVTKIEMIPNFKAFFVSPSISIGTMIGIIIGSFTLCVGASMIALIAIIVVIIWNRSKRRRLSIREKLSKVSKDDTTTIELRVQMKEWLIVPEDLRFENKIGSGGFGDVYKATLRRTTPVAVKVSKGDISVKEALICSTIKHPNVVQFLGVCIDDTSISLVYELMDNGTMTASLSKMEWRTKIQILRQVSCAMADLHNQNILHRDLKTDNILLDRNMNAKVSDFGLSKEQTDQTNQTVVGTPYWMAPEVILGTSYGKECDVYSFGIIMWQVLTNKVNPYEEDVFKVQYQVVSKGLRPPIPNSDHHEYVSLMKMCWNHDPQQRPNFNEVYLLISSLN